MSAQLTHLRCRADWKQVAVLFVDAPDDARLRLIEALVRTGEKDRAAFHELYDLTSAKLFGVCLRICGDRQVAEDVLHDVYLLVWRRAALFEPERGSPISWLAAIARNRSIDWRRANPVRATIPIDDSLPVADASPLASEALETSQEAHRLHLCLEALEPHQRKAIRTAFFEGVTYADLAVRMAVPLGTMKSWIRRGLASLKTCLNANG